MFNLDYIAANTGAAKTVGGEIFEYETLTSDASGNLTLKAAPIPVATGGTPYVWYRKSANITEMTKKQANSNVVAGFDANTEYCVMYRLMSEAAEKITISSQFIPDTLHAVLTVALYTGDSCNVEAATKAGEVVIDIPRLQLSGAMDISMTATGSAQTPLEGNALASGCTGCDGKAIYATITKYISGAHWYDDASGLVIEDLGTITAGGGAISKDVVVYAYYANKAPKQIPASELTYAFALGNSTGLSVSAAGKLTGTPQTGSGVLTVVAKEKATLEATRNIVVA